MLNHKEADKSFQFEYIEDEPLEFNENSFTSNLTSVLAFYAYVIIGLDYDSFALDGGSTYFQKALTIANNAQSSDRFGSSAGWQAFESMDNRYWLIENLTNSTYSQIHKAMYNYHRLGLDVMSEKIESGRMKVVDALREVQKIYQRKSDAYIVDIFLNSKSDEIVKMFTDSSIPPMEKSTVYNIMSSINPADIEKYEAIKK